MKDELYNAIWGHSLDDIKMHAIEAENINSKNKKSETALIAAVNRGNPEILNFLLTLPKIKLEIKNKYKQTALFIAAKNGDSKICEILLKAGAKINSKDYTQGNVLLASVQKSDCFKLLLKYNPDIHCRNELNMSAMTYLYNNKNINCIQELVSYSKDLEDINNFNQQREDIYNYHAKKLINKPTEFLSNQQFTYQVESIIENVKLKLNLDSSLEQRSTKIVKSKI